MAKVLNEENFHEFFNSCALGKAGDFMALLTKADGILIVPPSISHLLKGCELLQSLVDRGLVYLSVDKYLMYHWNDFVQVTANFTEAVRATIYLKKD